MAIKHLFIINPFSKRIKGKTEPLLAEIHAVMKQHPDLPYHIHVTRWSRDALGFCQKYVLDNEGEGTVRVHVMGSNGTLFEIVNAVIDIPNVEIAVYPMGRTNIFLTNFGRENRPLFRSIERQLAAETIPVDALRCNHNYGISNMLTGMEAYVDNHGDRLIEKTFLPNDICYLMVGFSRLFRKDLAQNYRITMDGECLDGNYVSVLVANHPYYSSHMSPAIDARPDSGVMDVYMCKDSSLFKRMRVMPRYLYGHYQKFPDLIKHYTCTQLDIASDQLMFLSIDGETFYANSAKYRILPGALRFVCPLPNDERKGD